MDRKKSQSGPGVGVPGRGGVLRHRFRGVGLAERTVYGGGRFRMCWACRVQRLVRCRRGTPEGDPAELSPRSGCDRDPEDGKAPGARPRPGQQGFAEEGAAARASRCPLRARGEASQVGKCGPGPRGAAIPGT